MASKCFLPNKKKTSIDWSLFFSSSLFLLDLFPQAPAVLSFSRVSSDHATSKRKKKKQGKGERR